jgi:hypothetical protein
MGLLAAAIRVSCATRRRASDCCVDTAVRFLIVIALAWPWRSLKDVVVVSCCPIGMRERGVWSVVWILVGSCASWELSRCALCRSEQSHRTIGAWVP